MQHTHTHALTHTHTHTLTHMLTYYTCIYTLIHTRASRATTIRDLSWENARIVLVGNKSDLTDVRTVTKESADDLARSLGVKYIETSAKEDINVKLTFDTLVDEISEKMAETMETNPNFVPPGSRARNVDSQKPPSSGCGC